MRYLFLLLFCIPLYAQTPLETHKVWLDSVWIDDAGTFEEIRTFIGGEVADSLDEAYIIAGSARDTVNAFIADTADALRAEWRSDISDSASAFSAGSVADTADALRGEMRDSINAYLDDSIGVEVQAYDAQLADIADGTLTGNFVNTAYPWADDEVADNITATSYLLLTAVGDSVEANAYYPGGTDVADADVADNITVTSYQLLAAMRDSVNAYLDDSIGVEVQGYNVLLHLDTLTWNWGVIDTVVVGALPGWKVPYAITITEIASYTDANTTTFNIEERAEATPNTAGTDALASDQVADTNQQEATPSSNPNFAKDTWATPTISATGDVAIFSITVRYIKQ